jgi:hypothetical protein
MSRPVPVAVLLEMRSSGVRNPLAITWEDGTRYEITASRFVGLRKARSAGSGECWICRIEGRDVPLYFCALTGRWWMDGKGESRSAPAPKPYRRVKNRDYKPGDSNT